MNARTAWEERSATFTEYLRLATLGEDGKWITDELECEVAYLYSPAEGDGFHTEHFPEMVSILSVRHETADDVIDLLPLLSASQIAGLKRTAVQLQGETA